METILKQVKTLLPSVEIDMGGTPVKQSLPTQKVNRVDPFLLVHHLKTQYFNDRPARIQGIGPHPHRGFSPVTFIIDGEIHHRDSRGNSQIAKIGEVQWMNAGAGIVHSERPSEVLAQRNGTQEIIQLWINSPAESKMKEPYYRHLSEEQIHVVVSEDNKVKTKVIAGSFNNTKSDLPTESELQILWGNAEKGGTETYQIPEGFNTMLYLINGTMRITGYGFIDAENLVIFEDEGNEITLTFTEDSQYLLLNGKPLNEKVSQSGPFVMNNQTEILEAMRDYQMGKMGVLIEED
ncbi:MAG: pirin family protein [Flavobacteriaceae bacterium]|nr:pirin family protein [Flavobacteriaceae bacterium]